MIKIAYSGFHKNLKIAVNHVNNLLQQEYFYQGIQKQESFAMADVNPRQLAELMRIADMQINIDLYYSLFPFSTALVADVKDDYSTIRLNKWNLNRPVESLCNTLMHECVHAVNAAFPQFSFGHGDEDCETNDNTAPFRIAALAQQFIAADNSIYQAMAEEEVSGLPFLHHFTGPVRKRPAYLTL